MDFVAEEIYAEVSPFAERGFEFRIYLLNSIFLMKVDDIILLKLVLRVSLCPSTKPCGQSDAVFLFSRKFIRTWSVFSFHLSVIIQRFIL